MPEWIEFVLFLLFAIPITFFDIKELRIPDVLTFGGILLFIALKLILKQESIGVLCLECAVGFGAFWLIRRMTQGRMGLGDAKYSALIAVSAGMYAWLASIFIAAVIGLLAAALLILIAKKDPKSRIPFAPFLTLGACLAMAFKGFYGLAAHIII
jgi:prepilin signal peptidase PulO-like enzyme (type II secretory pathway)